MQKKQIVILFFFLTTFTTAFSQAEPLSTEPVVDSTSNDSLELKIDEYADEKNGLRSLVLPGWGQVRNKQYVKGGAFLATVAGGVYTTLQYRSDFQDVNQQYSDLLQSYDDSQTNFPVDLLDELHEKRRDARSDKDIATGVTTYIHLVNVIDAAAQYKLTRDEENGKGHSALKAAYYSAILPGLGQAYNKKYWKIPIVYAALGTSVYFAMNNRDYHRDYRTALEYRSVGERTEFRGQLPESKLQEGLEYWRKWRDFAYVATGGVYLLNILDATVDAHLQDFNVDEDLSFRPSPVIDQINGNLYYGINLSFDLVKKEE